MAIEVVNRQRRARVDTHRVARLAEATLGAVGRTGADITIALVRDRVMRDLNKKYRDANQSTDVLSFSADADLDGENEKPYHGGDVSNYLGDIVVSTDTAHRQAREAGHTFARELDELVLHGVLHLCGFDHENDDGEMNRLELKLRKKLLA